MGRFIQLGALACLYLGAESKALRWQDDTPSWSPPRQTIAAMNAEQLGFSPAPTGAPLVADVELRLAKRVRGDDTCGYISGVSTNSIYCITGSCVINTFHSVVGCCASATMSDCRIATACLPSSSSRFYTSSDTLMEFCLSRVHHLLGGVAAIALIVFGVIFLLRKKKKDQTNAQQPPAPPVTYNGPPPQQGQPQMYQNVPPTQQASPGGLPPGTYPPGFVSADNRQSIFKPQYDVTTGSYEQAGVSPPASPPPISPSPTYQSGIPPYAPAQNGTSPTGAYPPQQPVQPQQQQQPYQQQGFVSELPATRGDRELRELA
ncbi:hypothetical protein CCHL11_08233 [Colletotrichum chlorophyti]|uniref:Uncharacterized protein n=1 Tax=Colletotrichum chlorophyti TaxID=708187 RepID=A0A1Q8RJF1_9PEZI|nr:hypothetical protein CCHL11_08233 [Colletotrichum chlorophyti]